MNKGWICLHRQIQDCWIWNDEPYSKGQAWVDMLLSANHDEKKIRIGSQLVTIQSGQFHTSVLKLARKWQWSEKKVKRFLTLLESDNMIISEGSAHGTTLTIINYGIYQGEGRTLDVPDDRTIAEHSTKHVSNTRPTNNNENNDNNENNENKVIKKRFTPPTLDELNEFVFTNNINIDPQAFLDHYESNGWLVGGRSKMKDWKAAVRNWERNSRKWNNNGGGNSRPQGKSLFDVLAEV